MSHVLGRFSSLMSGFGHQRGGEKGLYASRATEASFGPVELCCVVCFTPIAQNVLHTHFSVSTWTLLDTQYPTCKHLHL